MTSTTPSRSIMAPLAAETPIDLHLHTFVSDGWWHPRDLIDRLATDGIRVAAVCDHDNQRSVAEAIDYGERRGVHVIPGIELTIRWGGRQWHLLVYGVRPDETAPEAAALLELIAAQDARFQDLAKDARRRIEASGRPLPSLERLEIHGPLMPVHVLRAMIADRHVPRLKEAAELLVALGGNFTTDTELADVVAAAHEAGAVCLLAHPGRPDLGPSLTQEMLDQILAETPLDGIETHYRSYTDEQTTFYRGLAEARGLLTSAGSDSHGPGVPVDPRPYRAIWAADLLSRFGIEVEPPEGPVWAAGMDPYAVQREPEKGEAKAEG